MENLEDAKSESRISFFDKENQEIALLAVASTTSSSSDFTDYRSSSEPEPDFDDSSLSSDGWEKAQDLYELWIRAQSCSSSEDEGEKDPYRVPVQRVEIAPYLDCFRHKLVTFRVKRVVSPFEFYLECILDPLGYSGLHKHYFSENVTFQKFYKDPRNQLERALKKRDIEKGNCYACYFPIHQSDLGRHPVLWHRVRVHEINTEKKTALVFFSDLGYIEHVPFVTLRILDPDFVWPSQILRCYLYDVVPSTSSQKFISSASVEWSPAASQYFQKLMLGYKDKEVVGIIMNRSKTKVRPDKMMYEDWEEYINLGVVLYETSNMFNKEHYSEMCTINSHLVDRGFAKSIGMFSSCNHQFEIDKCLPFWNDKDFFTVFPHLNVEKTPPVPSPAPPQLQNGGISKEVIRFVTANAFSHGPVITSIPDLENNSSKAEPAEKFGLQTKISERISRIRMSYVEGPHYIIVHLNSQIESLQQLQNCLRVAMKAENRPETSFEIVPGMFLACQITDPKPKKSFWLRGVALQAPNENGRFRILTIDYGNIPCVRQDRCRPLPEFFQKIPSFSVRCHLDPYGVIPLYGKNGWTDETKMMFKSYLISWESSNPKYFMCRSSQKHVLEFNYFGQDIVFSHRRQLWTPAKSHVEADAHALNEAFKTPKLSSLCSVLTPLKDHPMLKSLFSSFGVEIFYEVRDVDATYFRFTTLADFMVTSGFAIKQRHAEDRQKRVHKEITGA